MSNKSRVLIILKELKDKTDEYNFLSLSEIKDAIYQQLDKHVNRKTIYDDIEILREAGFDIELKREGKEYGYYLASNVLDKTEIRILIDLLLSTNFITNKKTKEMVNKLLSQTSEYNRKALLKTIDYVHHKGSNEKIYYNVDAIQTALENKKGITFKYFDIDALGKKIYRKHDYKVIPYALVINEGRYYVITYTKKYQSFNNYRLDKMDSIEVFEDNEKRVEFDINEKMSSTFSMFTGQEYEVRLRCDAKLSNEVLDKFTKNMTVVKADDECFEISAKVAISPTFYSWLFEFGDKVSIIKPDNIIDGYINYLKSEIRKYEEVK